MSKMIICFHALLRKLKKFKLVCLVNEVQSQLFQATCNSWWLMSLFKNYYEDTFACRFWIKNFESEVILASTYTLWIGEQCTINTYIQPACWIQRIHCTFQKVCTAPVFRPCHSSYWLWPRFEPKSSI